MGSEKRNISALRRNECIEAYHAGKISAHEGARELGLELDTFLLISKTNGPDLSTYKRVVLYVKDEEDGSNEPRIIITENNLSHCMIHVSVIDSKAKNDNKTNDSPPRLTKRRNPEFRTPRKQKARKTIQHCVRPRVEADEILEMSPEPSGSAELSDDGEADFEEFIPSVSVPKKHKDMEPRDWKSSVELVQRIIGHDRLLNKALVRTTLAIRDSDAPIYRKYYMRHTQENGETLYMCGECRLENKERNGRQIPVIHLPSGDHYPRREHFCKGYSLVQLIAIELDRCNRLQLSSGHEINAKKAWEQGRIRALELTQQFGFSASGPDSILHHYPEFAKVQTQYCRCKRR